MHDNTHSEDVASFMHEFWRAPRVVKVYNFERRQGELLFHSLGTQNGRAEHSSPREVAVLDHNRIADHVCFWLSSMARRSTHLSGSIDVEYWQGQGSSV